MDNSSVRPTIEKIKLQEQDNEVRLREKRELNAVIMSLNRAIHDASLNIEKLKKEYESLIATTDVLQHQLLVATTREKSFTDQVNFCQKELAELRKTSTEGVSSVWQKRHKLFEFVKATSDKCDIWALLTKPTIEIKPNIIINQTENIEKNIHDDRLKTAIERRNKAIALRDFLINEPDVGDEFIRTRNALQYSIEIMAHEQNN